MRRGNGPSRREFIHRTSLAAVGGALVLSQPARFPAETATRSRVVLVRTSEVLDRSGAVRFEIVQAMLDSAVSALTGVRDPLAAWKTLIKPTDTVGIKSNGWEYLPTPRALERAIERRLADAGVSRGDVAVDDRGVLRNPVFQRATALINTRPMRTHHWAGVGSLVKNYITFVPNPSDYHPDSCADLASIWQLPPVKGKTRLNVLVLLTPQFHGVGPHNFNPRYVWRYHGLAVGVDPVAVDSIGLRIIEAKRREYFGDDRPLNPPAKHIALADTRHHLGTADPARIELITLGDTDRAP